MARATWSSTIRTRSYPVSLLLLSLLPPLSAPLTVSLRLCLFTDQSSTRGENGEYSDGNGGAGEGAEEEDPSSSSSYDNAKVRSLFGPPTPFGYTLSPGSPGSFNSGSKKIILPPITRRGTGDIPRDFDASQDYDDKSDSKLGRSASLGRGLLDNSSSNNVVRMSADTNMYSTSQRIKASPSFKRELSSRFDHSGLEERVDAGSAVPPLGRGQSISSIRKVRDYASADPSSGNAVSLEFYPPLQTVFGFVRQRGSEMECPLFSCLVGFTC